MKKCTKVLFLVIMLSAVFLYSLAFAEQSGQSGATGMSIPGLFDSMEARFNEGDYQAAFELALQIESVGGQNYSSASLYIGYLKGWNAMQTEDIDSAISYFRPIVAAGFKNAEGYFQYLMGRKEQENGNYATAIAYYQSASALQVYDGVSYQSECEMALQAEIYAAAERYIEQGNYQLAAQTFESLGSYKDSNSRKKECYYAYAGQLAEKLQYAEAAEVYNSLGLYEDSPNLAAKYYALAQSDISSSGITDLSAQEIDAQSLLVKWTDKLQLGTYTVTWYPGTMENLSESKTVNADTTLIERLVPSTTYHIIITSGKNEVVRAETTVATPQAPMQRDLRVLSQSILSYDQQDYYNMPLTQLQSSGKAHAIENGIIPMPSRSMEESGKGYMISCNVQRETTEDDQAYDYMCVLRIGDNALATSKGQMEVQGYLPYVSFYIGLTQLFDEIYAAGNNWPGSDANIDLYIGDSLLSQCSVSLSGAQ